MFEKVLENMYFNEPLSEGCFLFFLFFFCVVSNSLHFLTPLKMIMGRLSVCYCLLVQLTTPRGYFAEHFPGQWTKSTILLWGVGTQKAFIWGGFNRLPFSFVYHF